MAIANITQTFTITTPVTEPAPGSSWTMGTTPPARRIGEQNLPADYTLTEIQVNLTSISGATGSDPAIIRVWQFGRESAAATIELSGVGVHTQPIKLVVRSGYGADRRVIVDAWDPDTGSPNNTASLAGTVAIAGRPYYSIGGGVNTIDAE